MRRRRISRFSAGRMQRVRFVVPDAHERSAPMQRSPRPIRLAGPVRLPAAVGLILLLLAALLGVGSLQRAHAAVFGAPVAPHNLFALPMQDAITTVQDPNTAVTINVLRAGVVVGSASGVTDAAGVFEVNHPGGS